MSGNRKLAGIMGRLRKNTTRLLKNADQFVFCILISQAFWWFLFFWDWAANNSRGDIDWESATFFGVLGGIALFSTMIATQGWRR